MRMLQGMMAPFSLLAHAFIRVCVCVCVCQVESIVFTHADVDAEVFSAEGFLLWISSRLLPALRPPALKFLGPGFLLVWILAT